MFPWWYRPSLSASDEIHFDDVSSKQYVTENNNNSKKAFFT